jgi:hypothetical protein
VILNKLEENLATKQQRYIKREQEYRKTIDELQEEIKKQSINPFKIEGKGGHIGDEDTITRYAPSQKSQEIVKDFKEIVDMIDEIQVNTAKTLLNQKKDYCKILNSKYNQFQQKIDQEKEKTGENTADFKQREKELKENLETMTQIAQRIDNENISLIKKNSELNIEFKSQAQDKDLLIKQIIQQKKINTENMTKLSEKKHIAEELEKQMKEEQKMSEMSQSSKPQKVDPNTSFKRKKIKKGRGKSIKNGTRIILSQSKKNLKGAEFQDSIINMKTSSNFFKPGGRAYSANVYGNPKLRRYEQVIMKIKKMIVSETSKLRDIKTIYSKEIESKTQLEQLLRQWVDDVKAEITKKRSESKVMYYANKRVSSSTSKKRKTHDITQEEREKIIEVLLSQERVLTLLYDKTFPPKITENNQMQ